jgi:SRSO17 transposase
LFNDRLNLIMREIQSDKKNFQKNAKHSNTVSYDKSSLGNFIYSYKLLFQVAKHNRTETALQYIQGLLSLEKGKANMERMEEEIPESEYQAYQHFITHSKWDYKGILSKVFRDTSDLMETIKTKSKKPTGLIIDESAHLKKGEKSVAVGRQYAGVVGKVDNCQVGVYTSMVNDTRAGLVNERLFIPENWVKDKARCKLAGISQEHIKFKTKPQLALEMVDEMVNEGVKFDWVGGDGLYGHNRELRAGLDARGLLFILDVHKDETVFIERPQFCIPPKSGKRGRPSKKTKPDKTPLRVDKYVKQLDAGDWKIERKIRKTHKGWKRSKVHLKKVWVFEAESDQVKERTLIITQTMDGKKEIKYSLSNGKLEDYSHHEFAYLQSQRYWVERTFDDAKNEIGMSDYQIRKWLGWHHHHALVFMAGLYLLKQKIEHETEAPLMSIRDARILIIVSLFGTKKDLEIRLEQMKTRHEIRQKDIDRHYKT